MSNGKIILSALAGLAIGSIIGILLAPEKGSRTRRAIKNKSLDFVEDSKEKMQDYIKDAVDKFEKSIENSERLAKLEIMSQEEVNKTIS